LARGKLQFDPDPDFYYIFYKIKVFIDPIKSPSKNFDLHGFQTKKKPNGVVGSPVGLLSLTFSPLKVTRLSQGNESLELTF
jgi:hypothetical protein